MRLAYAVFVGNLHNQQMAIFNLYALHNSFIPVSHQRIVDFWDKLSDAKLEDGVLTLQEGTTFLGMSTLGSRLLVRPFWYPKMLSQVREHFEHDGRAIVIIGNPGNGLICIFN
jgi:hypothetical protein